MKGKTDMKNKKKWVIILCAVLVALMILAPAASAIALLFA